MPAFDAYTCPTCGYVMTLDEMGHFQDPDEEPCCPVCTCSMSCAIRKAEEQRNPALPKSEDVPKR